VTTIGFDDSGHVYAGVDVGDLFRSTDQGANWERHSTGINFQDMNNFANFGGRILFMGTDGNGMYRSTNSGYNWTHMSNGLTDPLIRAITIKRSGAIFVGGNSDGVFRSLDTGKTWTPVNTNLSNTFVSSLIAHPNGTLYAGTSGGGVFRSTNDGNSWTQINSGLTNLIIETFAIDSSGYIYAGTAGGGMFRSANPTTSVEMTDRNMPQSFMLGQNYPNPFNPSTTISYAVSNESHVRLSVFNVLGEEVAKLVDELKHPGNYEQRWDAASMPGGVYFYRIVAGNYSEAKKLILMK
jgi:photosystem II stability/assembly factor-like uncharacterized protein